VTLKGSAWVSLLMRSSLTLTLIACALPAFGALAQERAPSTDWASMKKAVWSQAVIASPGQPDRNARITFVDDSSVTFEDLDRALGAKFMLLRDEVSQVSKWTGFNGSVRGAVLGSVGGAAAGYLVARLISNSYDKCHTDCQLENALVYGALLVPPIAGGWFGYKMLPGNRRLVVIYVKP
jgi:hypothetical protein